MFQQLLECACIVLLLSGLSVIIRNFWLPAFNGMFVFVECFGTLLLRLYTARLSLVLLLVSVTVLAGAYHCEFLYQQFSIQQKNLQGAPVNLAE